MTTPTTHFRKIALILRDRDDGGIRISSPDIAALHLGGLNRTQVWELVSPAIRTLLLANHKKRVVQMWLPEAEVALAGPSPRVVYAHANVDNLKRQLDVVVEFEDA